MSIIETVVTIPASLEANIFGQFDQHVKRIEKILNVTIISRVPGKQHRSLRVWQHWRRQATLSQSKTWIMHWHLPWKIKNPQS